MRMAQEVDELKQTLTALAQRGGAGGPLPSPLPAGMTRTATYKDPALARAQTQRDPAMTRTKTHRNDMFDD